jgi:integrase
VKVLVLDGCAILDAGVAAARVVPGFDPLEDRERQLLAGTPLVPVEELALQSVRRQVTLVDGAPTVRDTKTSNAHRAVSLDPETVAVLRAHRRRQLEERLELGVRSDDGFMFTELDGSLIMPARVTLRFSQLPRDTGAPRVRLHDLRHSHATHLLDAGVSSKAVAARLGHSSVAFSLDKYAHATPEGDELAAAAVAALVDHDHR